MTSLHEVLRLERPLFGLDLETTGVNVKTAAICELGLEVMMPGQSPVEWRTLINPLMPIPREATEAHGITNELVQGAPTFLQLAPKLVKRLASCDFAGYNLWYDLQVLEEEFKRAAVPWSYEGARVIDGYRVWQLAEPRTLDDAAERWLGKGKAAEIDDGKSHSALRDTKVSTRVIAAQLRACQFLPRDVQRLHELLWPGRFDAAGKLRWFNGELCFTFGQHRDVPLRDVPKRYLSWVLGADFSDVVKNVCREALKGRYPRPPVHLKEGPNE